MPKMFTLWKGRPLSELSREELIEVIEHCGKEIAELRRLASPYRGHARATARGVATGDDIYARLDVPDQWAIDPITKKPS